MLELKNTMIISVAFLMLITGFSIYAFFHEDDYVREARNPETSIERGNRESTRHFLEGKILLMSYHIPEEGCITPIITESELERLYPDLEMTLRYHGHCRWLKRSQKSDPEWYYENNEWYATAYNTNMLIQIEMSRASRNAIE
tara:strand:- start:165475 stop:165903 length:429 start_codon:yes stop_codon:yes gene_type:complete